MDVEGFTFKQSDMKDKGIARYVKFLKKVAGINIKTDQGPYQEIKKRQKLRNKIVHDLYVHEEGNHRDDKHLRELIRKMDKPYLFDTIELIENFVNILLDEIERTYPGATTYEYEDEDPPED